MAGTPEASTVLRNSSTGLARASSDCLCSHALKNAYTCMLLVACIHIILLHKTKLIIKNYFHDAMIIVEQCNSMSANCVYSVYYT